MIKVIDVEAFEDVFLACIKNIVEINGQKTFSENQICDMFSICINNFPTTWYSEEYDEVCKKEFTQYLYNSNVMLYPIKSVKKQRSSKEELIDKITNELNEYLIDEYLKDNYE